jgi:hypothetical protein
MPRNEIGYFAPQKSLEISLRLHLDYLHYCESVC